MERKFNEQELARREKLAKLKELGVNPFADGTFKPTHTSVEIKELYSNLKSKEDLEADKKAQEATFKLTGRVMLSRGQGKAGFMQLKDAYGTIQLYVNKNALNELDFQV